MQLTKATRKKVKLRLGVDGVAGSGKTKGSLRLAYGLCGDWTKIAVIDTENSSASLYSNMGEYLVLDLAPPYSPERCIEAIKACEDAGMEVIIFDSTSHEWSGAGGCLEINESLAQAKFRSNTWSAWSETTPRHEKFLHAMLQSKCHIIACARSKMETVMGEDKKVKKVGMKNIQRDTTEYEWSLQLSIDRDTHKATAGKDRTELFENKDPFFITEETGKTIREWCETGIDEDLQRREELTTAIATIQAIKNFDVLESNKQALPAVIVSDASFADAYGKVHIFLLSEAAKVAEKKLKACKTLENLQTVYTGLSVPVRTKVTGIKDEMKTKLQPAASPVTAPANV